ncbi:MAG: hypothetical protein ACMXYF_02705 [Candidatus Woesearchaeota archaeon]
MTRGLSIESLGLLIGENYYSPSIFAQAYIGAMTRKQVQEAFSQVCQKSLDEKMTPVLAACVDQKLNLRDLESFAHNFRGSKKLINRHALKPTSKKLHRGSVAVTNQFVALVESRHDGRKRRAQQISANQALIQTPEDALGIEFHGGNPVSHLRQHRFTHLSELTDHDRDFYRSIQPALPKLNFVDYPQAVMLFGLEQGLKKEILLQFQSDVSSFRAFIPFAFSKTPELAFESVLRAYAPNDMIKDATGDVERNQAAIDQYLLGKVLLSSDANALLRKNLARRGITRSSRYFESRPAAIIRSLEEHMLERNRVCRGLSLEYANTPFQTASIVYDFPDSFAGGVRILYGDSFPMPLVKYVISEDQPPQGESRPFEYVRTKNPTTRINWARDRNSRKPIKVAREVDFATGKKVRTVLYEPTDAVLDRAAQLLSQRGILTTAYALRSGYIYGSAK